MKNILTILLGLFFFTGSFSQEALPSGDLYLSFEWMHVDDANMNDYWDVETFWEGIHQERANAGEILGWDLWSLLPGGSKQGSQFLVVTLYSSYKSLVSSGGSRVWIHAKDAYPDLSEEELEAKFNMTGTARDLAYRLFLKQIDGTDDDFDMPLGTVATIDAMMEKDDSYEEMESKIFKPWHQESVDNGEKANWGLLKILLPLGSDRYASHITVNMYEDLDQYANYTVGSGDLSMLEGLGVETALATREMKSLVIATLVKKVRPAAE